MDLRGMRMQRHHVMVLLSVALGLGFVFARRVLDWPVWLAFGGS